MKLLSTKEAAERLGVSERTVQRWCKQGRIRAVEKSGRGRGGTVFMIPEEEIRRLTNDTNDIPSRTNDTNDINDRPINDTNDIGDKPSIKAPSESLKNLGVAGRGEGGVPNSLPELGTELGTSEGRKGAELGTSELGTKGEEILIEDGEVWLTVEQVKDLLGVSDRAVRKACEAGKYKVKQIKSPGRKGFSYLIALTSLPPEAQRKWVSESPEGVLREVPEEVRERLFPGAQFEMLRRTAPRLEIGKHILLNPKLKRKVAEMLPAIEEALPVYQAGGLAFGEKSRRMEEIARRHGIAKNTLYLWVKRYLEGGVAALVKPRRKGPSAWDEEALELLKGAYLRILRETGKENKRLAYKIAVSEAEKRGLSVGSERSAYEYLKRLHPDVVAYAKGGKRAVKKRWWTPREWDIAPNEEWVGDQHRFDFFIQDKETGKVFRPEGFFWEDSRTRLIVGVALACFPHFRHYDAWLVGLALKLGVMGFGIPQRIYTDWGKPERSRYLRRVMEDLSGIPGMRPAFRAEKFRVDGGYAIVSEDGEVLEVVGSPQEWERRVEKLKKVHGRATPYNPQAKLVERAFQTVEGILLEVGVPGQVRNIRRESQDEKLLRSAELKRLAESEKLLSPEEFLAKVFSAVEIYNRGPHSALAGKSPLEAYEELAGRGEFQPVFIGEEEARLIFSAREWRKVDRGRVRLGRELYEARALREIPDGTPVEVRFDPAEGWFCAVWWEREVAVELRPAVKVSQRTGEGLIERLKEKAEAARLAREHFRRLISQVPQVVSYSKFTRVARRMKKLSAEEEWRLSEAEFERLIAEAEARQKRLPENVVPFPVVNVRELPCEPVDRYAALLDIWERTGRVPASEIAFMREFEARLTDSERKYWDFMRKFKGLPPIGEFGEVRKERAG